MHLWYLNYGNPVKWCVHFFPRPHAVMSSWWLEIDLVKVFTQQKYAISTNQGTPPLKPPAQHPCPVCCFTFAKGLYFPQSPPGSSLFSTGDGGGGGGGNITEFCRKQDFLLPVYNTHLYKFQVDKTTRGLTRFPFLSHQWFDGVQTADV